MPFQGSDESTILNVRKTGNQKPKAIDAVLQQFKGPDHNEPRCTENIHVSTVVCVLCVCVTWSGDDREFL